MMTMERLLLLVVLAAGVSSLLSGCSNDAPTSPNASGVAPTQPGASAQPTTPGQQQERRVHVSAMRDAARRAHARPGQ
jgi:hypothetical protein